MDADRGSLSKPAPSQRLAQESLGRERMDEVGLERGRAALDEIGKQFGTER